MSVLKTISLIGMPACGKSVCGRNLANHYGVRFIDSDHEIELKCSMTIPEIFTSKGEEYFRQVEEEVILNIVNTSIFPIILSTGGGAFENQTIREKLLTDTKVVFLKTQVDTIIKRIKLAPDNKRPLLSNIENIDEFIRELYQKRMEFYELAHFVIDNSHNDPKVAVKKIVELLK